MNCPCLRCDQRRDEVVFVLETPSYAALVDELNRWKARALKAEETIQRMKAHAEFIVAADSA